ncbi:MAG: bifunctional diaminohydroxyphosphoribosylaminopyrimidine deaminase/5-amino-6-(5-phosphoribosylamino)uracil reductase RibD, partial [Actinobacteria bacterium]|nr:bifunctional diaminohydroxyphosphoribosylaminopyrimidine deaminase/5-amino-6-(5-phosphoribosylamino)uracil reductase RibD [Actinomycetota bacterium]
MARAVELAASVRCTTSPNPWVGCVVVAPGGATYEGATEPAGGRHAEVVALDAAGEAAKGATAYVTLEPCAHHGRTPPCVDALIGAGIARVVVAVLDPDERVAGRGIDALRAAGIAVDRTDDEVATAAATQLEAYLVQRRTGRPYVVCKLAASMDGRTAAADGTSQWITGIEARTDAHRLRAESDVIVVGAGTVRADDPSLTVRHVPAPGGDPRRIVLGSIPAGAKVLPAEA